MSAFNSARRGLEETRRLGWAVVVWWLLHVVVSVFGQGTLSVLQPDTNSTRSIVTAGAAFLIIFTFYSVFWLWVYGGILGTLNRPEPSGNSSVRDFIDAGRRWFWQLGILTSVLWGLLLGLTLLFAASGGLAVAVAPWLGLVNAVVMVGALIVVTILLIYSPIALVHDQQGVREAFRTSIRFSREHFWETVQILLVTAAGGLLFAMFLFVALLSTGQVPQGGVQQLPLWAALLMDGFSAALMVFLTASLSAFYQDLP